MDAHPELLLAAKFLLLLVGLLVPGSAIMRALGVPASLATSFVGSTVALYVTVLALQLSGERISLLSLSAGLALITIIAQVARRRESHDHDAAAWLVRARNHNPITGMGPWAPAYLIFGVAIAWRAWHQPLAGPDVEFRWTFLAEQMLRLGSLDFYPPRTADDFLSYFWVESIPPGASALHAWAYACAGSSNAVWTAPAVMLQLWTLHELLWRTAERIGGIQAARFACLAAAACPLLTWSIVISQETGLTAIALIGIAYSIHVWTETRSPGWAALVGVFAVLGASAREYGLVFPALAGIGLVVVRASWRAWLAFLTVAAIGLVWPVRVWLLTGNPFYSLAVGSSLPVNARFLAWIEHDAAAFGSVLRTFDGWAGIGRYLLLYGPFALVGWGVLVSAAFRRWRHAALGLAMTFVVLTLWAASVRYTNGGAFYSLRVTSPALTLGCLAAGAGIARFIAWRPRSRISTTALASLFVLALLPATLALPSNPWRTPWREWPTFRAFAPVTPAATDESVTLVRRALAARKLGSGALRRVVLADSPGYQRRFQPFGIPVIPLWSPAADWLFDPTLPSAEALRRWRESRVDYIIVTKWQSNVDFFNQHSRWARPPFQLQPVGETPFTTVFAIRAAE